MRRSVYMAIAGALALALLVGAWLVWRNRPASVALDGAELPSINAELFFLDVGDLAHRGSSRVVVLRFSGGVELVPHHFAHEGLERPLPVEEWQKKLDAPVVFNAGQFDEALNHLGWLKGNDEWLSRNFRPSWKGLLLSGPKLVEGQMSPWWARIVDLEVASAEVEARYKHAIQSMMLVDERHVLRVRDTDRTACRTVVAEDERGRLLVLFVEGAVTLGDLGRWLPTTTLGIVRAMNLDGGVESQLVVATPEFNRVFYGQYGTGTTVLESGAGQMIRHPLPAVIAVRLNPDLQRRQRGAASEPAPPGRGG